MNEEQINQGQERDPWKHRSGGMKCQTCMWYANKVINDISSKIGRCRRHAPVVCVGYPVVFPHDWCGDYKMDETKI